MAFDTLKEQVTAVLLLTYPDFRKQCVGAVLTQLCPNKEGPVLGILEELPIYFLSHKISGAQQKWQMRGIEAYAIMYALQKLNYYLN